MLDAYIIEEIKKREDERLRREELNRPRLHIEIDDPRMPPDSRNNEEEDHDSEEEDGAVRIDLYKANPSSNARSTCRFR